MGCRWTLQWRHNGRDGVSNHQPHDCLLNRLFRRRSKKTTQLRVTGLCAGGPVNSPHKWPVTRKMFPFDDVIKGLARVNILVMVVISMMKYDVNTLIVVRKNRDHMKTLHPAYRALGNVRYSSSEIYLKFKSREIMFVPNRHVSWQIVFTNST